jgi:hypothetical protein
MSNDGKKQKTLKLKWNKNEIRQKLTQSLQSALKGKYEKTSVDLFVENCFQRLKLDEIYDEGCTNEIKNWIVGHDKSKPTVNAITHIPKLISQIVLQKQDGLFNRPWVRELLMAGSNDLTTGMINALTNLVRIGIVKIADKSFQDGNYLWYCLSHDLFDCLKGQEGNENGKEKKNTDKPSSLPPKPGTEMQYPVDSYVDLTMDGSSDDSSDDSKVASSKKQATVHCALTDSKMTTSEKVASSKKQKTVVGIPAAVTNSVNPEWNLHCASTDSKMTTSENTTDDNTSSDEPPKNLVQDYSGNDRIHPILRCEIPWDNLDLAVKSHMMTLGFHRHSWQGEQIHIPPIFLLPWYELNDKLKAAAGAFGWDELSWNNQEPADIFIKPKLAGWNEKLWL